MSCYDAKSLRYIYYVIELLLISDVFLSIDGLVKMKSIKNQYVADNPKNNLFIHLFLNKNEKFIYL